jgi:hypothetical protein
VQAPQPAKRSALEGFRLPPLFEKRLEEPPISAPAPAPASTPAAAATSTAMSFETAVSSAPVNRRAFRVSSVGLIQPST